MARRRGRHGHRGKLPILTLAALALPIADAIANSGGRFDYGANRYLMSYTGVDVLNKQFVPGQMVIGLGPLAVLWAVKKTGILRSARVGKMLPVSLS